MFAHLVVDLLVAKVGLDADARGLELGFDIAGIVVGVGHDRRHHGLHRGQPHRQLAGIVFDQDADEAFIRSKDRAVQHDRAMLLAVLGDIGGVEPFGQHAVGLDRADLPGAADRVGQVPFQLGRIERAFAGQFLPAVFGRGEAGGGNRIAQFGFGLVPHFLGAEAIFRAQRQLDRIGKPEVLVDAVGQRAEGAHFLDDLVLAAEDVRIVLGELAHAHQPVQRAVRLVAVAAAVLVDAQRQVAVGFDALAEDQHLRRAVHRLQGHPVGIARDDRPFIVDVGHFIGDDEHVLAVLAPVARLLPLARIHDLRGLDLAIAGIVDGAAHVGFQLAPHAVALGMPEHAAVRFGLEVEQVHLGAQLAVIALCGLFKAG